MSLDPSNIGMAGSNPALGMDRVSRFTVETVVCPNFLSERNVWEITIAELWNGTGQQMSALTEMLQFYPIQHDTEIYLPVCHLHPTVTQIPFIIDRM
jgi:hypothetical protein